MVKRCELSFLYSLPCAEIASCRDNLSAIVIGDNLLPIIVIAQNSFDLSITDIAFEMYFVIAINDFFCTQ